MFAGSIPEIIDIVKTFPKYNGTYVNDRGRRHVDPTIRCFIIYIIYVSCKIRMNYYISPLRHTLYRTISLLYLMIVFRQSKYECSTKQPIRVSCDQISSFRFIKNFWFLYQLTTNLLYKYLEMCNLSLRYFPSVDFISQNISCVCPLLYPIKVLC